MYVHVSGLQSCEFKLYQNRKRKIQGDDKWKMSKQAMESCVDVLAPRILAVWDIEKEPEWYEGQFVFQEDLSSTSHDKVQAWLTSSVQDEKQNSVPHSGLSKEQASSFNALNVSSKQEDIGRKSSKASLNTPQTRKHTPKQDLHKTPHDGLQNVSTHYREKFATSTPLNSVLRHNEGPTQDTLQVLDPQMDDTASQDMFVSQDQNTYALTSTRCTIQESPESSQDEECMILSQTTSKMKKKDTKIHSKNAFVAGF
jgi:hypothetical protein